MKNEMQLAQKMDELIAAYDCEQPFSDDPGKNRFELIKKILVAIKEITIDEQI